MASAAEDTGSGVLVLVAGPSGAGKDTLIGTARAHFHGDARVVFPRRVVTRASDVTEQVRQVSMAEFDAMAARGEFFMAWQAHGLGYGIPAAALTRLEAGSVVIANVSRRIIADAFTLWPRSHAIYVHVEPDILRARLQSRGRETAGQIGARLLRHERIGGASAPADAPEGATVIYNSGPIAQASAAFIDVLEAQAARAQRAMSRNGVA